VPYKGTPVSALIAGEVSLAFQNVLTATPHIKSGRVRVLAITSKTRSRLLPDVPTIAETVVPEFEATNWFGVLAPRGTPRPVITRLSSLIATHINAADTKERLLNDGAEALGSTPEAFASLIAAELKRWREVVKSSGAKLG
jgi:tripartite-type tricarboxylate transporter receptor subunit TctC